MASDLATMTDSLKTRWKEGARRLRVELRALGLARRDPRVSWQAKALAGALVAYAVSPIDLIPDFIPVLGQLDDLVILPLGAMLLRRMIPSEVLAECRARAAESMPPDSRAGDDGLVAPSSSPG